MGIIFTLYKIIGLDLSQYNDNPDTPQKIDFHKLKELGVSFVAIRTSYGIVTDAEFNSNWSGAKEAMI